MKTIAICFIIGLIFSTCASSGILILVKQRDNAKAENVELRYRLAAACRIDADTTLERDSMSVSLEVASDNLCRETANLYQMHDFADALQRRLDQFEARAVLDGRSTPIGKAPGWPTMRPMVYAQWRTNSSGLLFLEIKEAGR